MRVRLWFSKLAAWVKENRGYALLGSLLIGFAVLYGLWQATSFTAPVGKPNIAGYVLFGVLILTTILDMLLFAPPLHPDKPESVLRRLVRVPMVVGYLYAFWYTASAFVQNDGTLVDPNYMPWSGYYALMHVGAMASLYFGIALFRALLPLESDKKHLPPLQPQRRVLNPVV